MISNHFLRWPHPLHTTTHTPSDNGCTTDRLKLTKVPITNVIRSHVVTSGGKILPFVAFAFTSSRGWTVGPFINPPMLFICTTIYLITWVIESTMLSVWNNMVLLFFWIWMKLFPIIQRSTPSTLKWELVWVSSTTWPCGYRAVCISCTTPFHAHAWKCRHFHWEPERQHSLIRKSVGGELMFTARNPILQDK